MKKIFILFTMVTSICLSQTPTNGLIAYYPFNGNTNDESGNNLHLNIVGTPQLVEDRFHHQNSAYYFNGNTDFMVHDSVYLLKPTNEFTINVWVNNNGIDDQQDVIISTLDYPDSGGYQIALDNNANAIIFSVRNPGNNDVIIPYLPEYYGKWIMITATYSNQHGMKLFVDAVLKDTNTNQVQIVYQGLNNFRVGTNGHSSTSPRTFKGSIDDIRFYNRVLSDDEVRAFFESGLIAYYPFNGNANDESGNNLHLNIIGAPQLVEDRFHHQNSAYYFNGYTDFMVHDSVYLLKPSNEFTINVWINNNGIDDQQDVIISTLDYPDLGGYQIALDNNADAIIFSVRDPGNNDITIPYLPEYYGKWIMITATYSNLYGMKLFVDAVLKDTNTNQIQIVYQGLNNFRIGTNGHSSTSPRDFMGSIDDIRFYNRVLSTAEIESLYNPGTGINDKTIELSNFQLLQNYPNPFNPSTKICYSIPISSFVTLKIYDVIGKEIATLVSEHKGTGYYEETFNAGNISNGIYFYELRANEFREVKKLTLLK